LFGHSTGGRGPSPARSPVCPQAPTGAVGAVPAYAALQPGYRPENIHTALDNNPST
jgi:hypothetical protein